MPDRIPYQEIEQLRVEDEDATVAASQDFAVDGVVVEPQREARRGDAVRRVERGSEHEVEVAVAGEEAEEGRRVPVVVVAEAAEEMGVGDEAAPPLADERGAGQRREAEEDLG